MSPSLTISLNSYLQQMMQNGRDYLSYKGYRVNELPSRYARLMKEDIPGVIKRAVSASRFIVKGSIGQGLVTNSPWIAILDKGITTTTQKGYYMCFLFSDDMCSVYLTFDIGITELQGAYGSGGTSYTDLQIRNNAASKRALLMDHVQNDPDFSTNTRNICVKFRDSVICCYRWDVNNPRNGEVFDKYLQKFDLLKQLLRNGQTASTTAAYTINQPSNYSVAESSTARSYGDKTYEDGVKAGRSSERKAIIKQMRAKGLSDTLIAAYTGLPLSYITKI